MPSPDSIPAALALDALSAGPLDARAAFALAADAHYRGIAFATNHPELNPDLLTPSARRHVKSLLAAKSLSIDSLRVAYPRGTSGGGLSESATIDRTLDNARKALLLARELSIPTVALHIGNLSAPPAADAPSLYAARTEIPESTLISALRELAQQADAAGLSLALSSNNTDALARVLKAVDFDRATLNLDGARAIESAEDPLQLAQLFHGHVGQFTAADALRAGQQIRATPLGQGQLPLAQLLETLRETNFHGPLVVDVRNLPDPAAAARHAAALLQKLLHP